MIISKTSEDWLSTERLERNHSYFSYYSYFNIYKQWGVQKNSKVIDWPDFLRAYTLNGRRCYEWMKYFTLPVSIKLGQKYDATQSDEWREEGRTTKKAIKYISIHSSYQQFGLVYFHMLVSQVIQSLHWRT